MGALTMLMDRYTRVCECGSISRYVDSMSYSNDDESGCYEIYQCPDCNHTYYEMKGGAKC